MKDMEYIIKSAVAAVIAAILSLVIRKNTPELSLVLGLTAAMLAILFAVQALRPVFDFLTELKEKAILAPEIYVPVLKCLGIGIITQLGAGICRDAGQSAAATGVELCGTAAAMLCTIPLVCSILELMGKLA